MATSGSVDFELNASQIIKMALFNLGVLAPNGTPTTNQTSNAMDMINLIVKSWHDEGLPLHALKIGYVLPQDSVDSMAINSHCVTSYAQTTVATAADSGATSIVVASITGISDSDQVGFEVDDGSIHWTTVSSSSSATITIATGLDDTAAVGNVVYYYTAAADRITRPERIDFAQTYQVKDKVYTPMDVVTFEEYNDLGTKTTASYPTQLYYDPQLGNNAQIFFWPRFGDGKRVIKFRYRRPFEDFDASTDTPDFPANWNLLLVSALSYHLSPGYGLPLAERKQFLEEYMKLRSELQGSLQEEGSIFLGQDYERDC